MSDHKTLDELMIVFAHNSNPKITKMVVDGELDQSVITHLPYFKKELLAAIEGLAVEIKWVEPSAGGAKTIRTSQAIPLEALREYFK